MNTENTKAVSRSDIECANVSLESGCDALSAIANAIEILSAIQPPPDKLFSHTITRLAAHAVYLADTVNNDVGCFIERVEKASA